MKKGTVKPHAINSASTKDMVWLAIIAGMAIVVRVVFALDSSKDPFGELLFLDAKVYHLLAEEIATKNFWGSEVFFRAPLFPYLLGITYKFFGIEQIAIKVVNSLLGIVSVLLAYFIARIHFDERIARTAGLCLALYPTLYFFEIAVMPTALEVFSFTATIFFFSRYQQSKRITDLVIGGITLGLATLARPTIMSLLIILPFWLYSLEKRGEWLKLSKKFAAVAVPFILVILPVTVRNYIIEPKLVLISSQGGANFFIGNNENADGQTVVFPFGQTPLNKYEDHIWSASNYLAERDLRRTLTAAEVSSYWFDKGQDFVRERPGEAVELLLKKTYLLFCGEELFNNKNPMAPRDYSTLYSLSVWDHGLRFPYGIIAPLFLIGSVFLVLERNKRALLLLFVYSQVITLALFFVSSRFRQPLLPVIVIVAVYCVFQIYSKLKSRQWRSLIISLLSLILLTFVFNPPFEVASTKNRSMSYALAGGALASKGNYPEAVEQLREAIVIDENNATAFQILGSLYVMSGQIQQALAVLHRAEELAPDAIQTKSILARVYFDQKNFERALPYFEDVIASGAKLERFNYWAARSAYETGDMAKARNYLSAALSDDPTDLEIQRLRESMEAQSKEAPH